MFNLGLLGEAESLETKIPLGRANVDYFLSGSVYYFSSVSLLSVLGFVLLSLSPSPISSDC